MKNKFLYLALALCMVLACHTGCRRNRENKGSADVHVFYYTYSDPYISSVRSALSSKLNETGLTVQEYDSNNSQTTQTEQVQTAITKGAKMIVVNIVTTGSDDASSGIVRMAKDAGIPVVFFNREVSDSVVNSYEQCAFVGTDAAEAGYLQGDMVGDYVAENFDQVDLNGDGRISYVLFMGEQGNNEAIYRTKYAVENANKKLTAASQNELVFYDSSNADGYLLDKDGKWSAQAANEYMTTALTSYNAANDNMIELVICNNDNMAEGAITALQTAGFNTGVEGTTTIPVFGVDATDAAKELIKAGKMTGTIKQDADGMATALAKTAKNGIENRTLLDDMSDYIIDEDTAKVRIPYDIYLGEE
ncbi:MAG: substrate-binding domain-containing protein [Clostridiales bacterium]|nr:substrate-binding domain-containing protein [Clostridiales bacterium]